MMKVSSNPTPPTPPRKGDIVDDTLKIAGTVGDLGKSLAGAGGSLKPLASEAVIAAADGYVGHALATAPDLPLQWIGGIGGAAHLVKGVLDVGTNLDNPAETRDIPRNARGVGHVMTGAGMLAATFGAGTLALPMLAVGVATRLGAEWAVNEGSDKAESFVRYGTELSSGAFDGYLAYANNLDSGDAAIPLKVGAWSFAAAHAVKGVTHFIHMVDGDEKRYHGTKFVGEAMRVGGLVTSALGGGTHGVAVTGLGVLMSLAADISRE